MLDRKVKHYALLAVGHRVNSKRATASRLLRSSLGRLPEESAAFPQIRSVRRSEPPACVAQIARTTSESSVSKAHSATYRRHADRPSFIRSSASPMSRSV